MLVVEDLLRGVDAEGGGELDGFAVCCSRRGSGAMRPSANLESSMCLSRPGVVADGEDLFAGEAERCGGLAGRYWKRQDAHADEVGAVDALVAFGDDELDAEQARALGGPVARAA